MIAAVPQAVSFDCTEIVFELLRPVWRGINAPTFPFCYFTGVPIHWLLGFGAGEILYLCAVAVLWYTVGRGLDGRNFARNSAEPQPIRPTARVALLMAVWGVMLLVASVYMVNYSLHLFEDESVLANLKFLARFRPETLLTHLLFLSWSAILIVLSIKGLTHRKAEIRV